MNWFFADITVFSLPVSFIKSSSFNLSMRKSIHVHHSITGLFLSITIATLVILLSLLKHWHANIDHITTGITVAALYFGSAVRILTNQLTFWFRTLWFLTLPVTFGFFTDGFTFWFRHLTMGDTMWFFTNGHTFWTVIHLTCFIRTHYLTVWFLTFHITYCIFRFLTWTMAFWGFTNWSTNCITFWVITFPATFWVAF